MLTQKEGLELYAHKLREMHAVALEENATLRRHRLPDEDFLLHKKDVAEKLDCALRLLAHLEKSVGAEQEAARRLQLEIQDQMLQIIMLDRENETLLLKASWEQRADSIVTVDLGRVRGIYGAASR